MRGIVTGGIFIAILFAFETNGIDLKQYSDVELIEVKTTDENGNVKARVVARSVDSEGPGVDDEDSKSPDGSGDRDTKADQYGDQPMNVVNNGTARESTRAIISPSPSISIDKDTTKETLQISSTTKVATKTRSLNSVESTSRETLQPSLKPSESIVIEPTSTVTSTQVSSLVSVTERPSLLTTEVTTEPKTTAGGPSTTSYDSPTTRLNVNKLTTESMSIIINGTKEPVVNTKSSVENVTSFANKTTTTVKPTSKSTSESSLNVNAHRDPTEKPRNTLFGFVTVEILIALLAGALFSILLVAFLVYRLKKRNEGSYELSETIALRPKELDEMGTKKEVFV